MKTKRVSEKKYRWFRKGGGGGLLTKGGFLREVPRKGEMVETLWKA